MNLDWIEDPKSKNDPYYWDKGGVNRKDRSEKMMLGAFESACLDDKAGIVSDPLFEFQRDSNICEGLVDFGRALEKWGVTGIQRPLLNLWCYHFGLTESVDDAAVKNAARSSKVTRINIHNTPLIYYILAPYEHDKHPWWLPFPIHNGREIEMQPERTILW